MFYSLCFVLLPQLKYQISLQSTQSGTMACVDSCLILCLIHHYCKTPSDMQELEDVVVEAQWHNNSCEGQDSFLNMAQVSGITMNESQAIAQHF
jgi:hypothetical protein